MSLREKIELVLIVVAAAAAWALSSYFPHSLPVGFVILTASVLLLGQGLIRDLWIKFGAKEDHPAVEAAGGAEPQKQKIVCMCMESTIGVVGVIGGLSVLLCGVRYTVPLAPFFWPLLVLVVCSTGFFIKDFVLDWKAKSVRRVKDHRSVIPW